MIHTINCMHRKIAFSKHVDDIIIIKLKKVHLVGFIIQVNSYISQDMGDPFG